MYGKDTTDRCRGCARETLPRHRGSVIDGINVGFVVWLGNAQLLPLIYAVLRSEDELVVEHEFDVDDKNSALDEACFFCSR